VIVCCVLVGCGCILWITFLFSVAFKGQSLESSVSSPLHNSVRALFNEEEEEDEKEKADSILVRLDQLASSIQVSSSRNESKFIDRCRRECIPGRDDKSGEINPTTHNARECLRHVSEKMRQRPRIGIMIPPGRIGRAFADWIVGALTAVGSGGGEGENASVDIDIVVTSHVPVYGYGKSHGYTKLIRFLMLPLPLAAYDAYTYISLLSTMTVGDGISIADASLRGGGLQSKTIKPASALKAPTPASIGMVLRLMMRWHCRLSHVAAHTAMVTISLQDILRDPSVALGRILSFVWSDDWEWEGGEKEPQSPENRNKEKKASQVVDDEHLVVDRDGSLRRLLDLTLLVLDELSTSDDAVKKSLQDAFTGEMKLSKDMTAWPCPSFWNGVNSNSDAGDDQMRIIRQISTEIVPDCSDDNPFARCTVNRDRCEVRSDSQCAH